MNLKEFVNVQNMTFKSSESCFFFLGMTDVRIKEKTRNGKCVCVCVCVCERERKREREIQYIQKSL